MSDLIPLPRTIGNLAQQAKAPVHPGLLLDKFVRCVNRDFSVPGEDPRGKKWSEAVQSPTIRRIVEATKQLVEETKRLPVLGPVRDNRRRFLKAVGAVCFTARNTTPLTLHLARASALENAGICLHRIYGFAYLPGSGLKGMARAYAETVWFPAQYKHDKDGKQLNVEEQKKAIEAWAKIEAVFGWSPNSDQKKPWKPQQVQRSEEEKARKKKVPASAGAVVFHDAWCKDGPPRLIKDIVNNHHPKYYREKGAEPPGDWENPVPVYFLAVAPGQEFEFALSLRQTNNQDDKATDLLKLATEWLIGALTHTGAGAKTNTGYGQFELKEPPQDVSADDTAWKTAEELGLRKTASFTVELVTPAFLAGADQGKDDCDLRGATLRGLLRWWWRTMHAGFLTPQKLYELESAIWGNTGQGGAVQVVVERISNHNPEEYNKRIIQFSSKQKVSQYGIPGAVPDKTTQGLWYISRGMDDPRGDRRFRRYFQPAGKRWKITIICKPYVSRSKNDRFQNLSIEDIYKQVVASLWLLAHYGGIGSKSRKGFGSLQLVDSLAMSKQVCQKLSRSLRTKLGLRNTHARQVASSSLDVAIVAEETLFPWSNVWSVLDQVGFAYQSFAKKKSRCFAKKILGLPRHIKTPARDRFRLPKEYQRFASPVHIHLDRGNNGFIVRIIAFPSIKLNWKESQRFLGEFIKFMEQDLRRRASLPEPDGSDSGYGSGGSMSGGSRRPPRPGGSSRSPGGRHRRRESGAEDPSALRAGKRVQAQLLEEKTKKGRWRAKELRTGFIGPIVNSQECPADWQSGQTVELIVASVNERKKEASFRYQP